MNFAYLALIITVLSSCVTNAQIDSLRILKHIKQLSDDSYQGRGSGTAGEKAAAVYIESVYKDLKLTPLGEGKSYSQAFPFNKGMHGEGEAGTSANLVAFLDNKANNTIIIGAHYDHLGMDGQGSSLDANPADKIHNGADDNASGVAGVLELAAYFAGNKIKEKSNFVFVCFSGEELGLIGSKYFTEHSPIAISTINYMINMDMIGRLDPQSKTLIVHGTGTSTVWEPLLQKLGKERLTIKTDSSGVGPSDHTSFYLKNIPVLHFFTGSHSDYHKPSDDWEKINAGGQGQVLQLIVDIVSSLDGKEKLTFLKTKTKSMAGRSSFKVTLGIMPSYAGDVDGLKVDGVSDGKPANKAGIREGDIIIEMGDVKVHDIQNYMDALNKFEKGQTVPVKVKRGAEVITVSVTF